MTLYHIEFTGNNEKFEKIGITKHDVWKRFGHKTSGMYKVYTVKILDLLDIPDNICREAEKEIHKEFANVSYQPLIENFSGKTECFEPNIVDISNYKKLYNKYEKLQFATRTESDTIHYDFDSYKLKIKVKNLYKKQELLKENVQETFYISSLTGSNKLTALIKSGKLYAKQLNNGYFYKIEDNEF